MAEFGTRGYDPEPPDEPVPGTWGTDGGAGGFKPRTGGESASAREPIHVAARRAVKGRLG